MRVEKKIVTTEIYYADDGKEFTNKKDCEEYEAELKAFEAAKEAIKDLRLKTELIPCNGEENMESHYYEWYKVNSEEDWNKLIEVYYCNNVRIKNYPEYVCVDRYDETDYDCWASTLTGCKEYVQKLFAEFGYTVEFKKNESEE